MTPPDHTRGGHPANPGDGTSDRFGYLFDLIGDAVIELEFVDTTPLVRAVNPAFEDIFGYDRQQVLDESLNDYIIPDEHRTDANSFDERTAAGKSNHAIVRRRTATGIREFLYRGVPYERADGRRFGFAIYSDITEQRTYERHIKVIHRILRHNLRNELSVIIGTAQLLEADADDEAIQSQAARINNHAYELASIGQEAQTLEGLLTDDRQPEIRDVVPICTDAAETVRDRTTGTVELDLPDRLRLFVVPELSTALEALLENGLVHNDSDDPTVCIRSGCQPKRAVIEIADNGSGIPESEREPVFGDGQITQLQHGTGLGLWLARCTAEVCDGHIEYDRVDGWTTVRLVLRPA